jgi:hypothetical protein
MAKAHRELAVYKVISQTTGRFIGYVNAVSLHAAKIRARREFGYMTRFLGVYEDGNDNFVI